MPTRPTTKAALGFTLIELLVALVLMSLLALLSWRSIDGMVRSQQQTEQHANDLLRLQAALGQWAADLDALIETGEVQALDFDGQLLRLTRRDSSESALHSPGLRVVAWRQRGARAGHAGQWVRWQSEPIRQREQLAHAWQRAAHWSQAGAAVPAPSGGDSSVALIGLLQWQLFYHRGDSWTHPLSAVGLDPGTAATDVRRPGQRPAAPPDGVRLLLELPAGQRLSGSLVRDWVRPTLGAAP
ncbi:prepilin-type N-terminal cleavage/methylation domain-containing protein [Hydrogenophaga sp.]|uniref:PulJ/GspJ family protein n=1 Tax=Hydrogenophaga sp. TaxID=1904254 RepID=UPI00198B2ADC|nr:prepilin-type N-terminal cleavage/methylation domain-containing protein [Hydrogenophaga sp.]MBD3892621.1 prepilin-type N-terminal cleavage/methylation domain-containing protein [Hydrogenophaga sp.]